MIFRQAYFEMLQRDRPPRRNGRRSMPNVFGKFLRKGSVRPDGAACANTVHASHEMCLELVFVCEGDVVVNTALEEFG